MCTILISCFYSVSTSTMLVATPSSSTNKGMYTHCIMCKYVSWATEYALVLR